MDVNYARRDEQTVHERHLRSTFIPLVPITPRRPNLPDHYNVVPEYTEEMPYYPPPLYELTEKSKSAKKKKRKRKKRKSGKSKKSSATRSTPTTTMESHFSKGYTDLEYSSDEELGESYTRSFAGQPMVSAPPPYTAFAKVAPAGEGKTFTEFCKHLHRWYLTK